MHRVTNKCSELISQLTTKSIEIKLNEPLAMHTSFKIGGPCSVFVTPSTEKDVKSVVRYAEDNNLSLIVIGNGTNILFPDKGFDGCVMRIAEPYFCDVKLCCRGLTPDGTFRLEVGAGISMPKLLNLTVEYGLSGLEFMSGIPGTLGGAIVMNAGAQGKRISELIERVKVMNRQGAVYWVNNQDAGFGYRESRFRRNGESALGAELNLKQGDPTKINAQIQKILNERETKLPLEFPSAGCVFKNPPAMPAGKLIELSGCKGMRIGDAQVSDKHANFIINLGTATYEDIKTLIKEIQVCVYKKFKIALEPELIIL